MKRRAEHHLDRDEFLRGGDDEGAGRNEQPAAQGSNQATAEQMAQRRIVKLKLPSQVLAEQAGGEENRPAAKLELASGFGAQATPVENAQPTTSAAPSFLSTIYNPNQEAQNGSNPAPAQGSLFSGILGKTSETAKAPEEKKEEEKKPGLFGDLFKTNTNQAPAPLFSASGSTTGLFGSNNQSATNNLFNQPTTGLFSGLFKSSDSGSLANLANKDYSYVHKESGEKPEEKKEEQKPVEKPAESKPTLFASLDQYKPATNLFSGDNAAKPGLFANFATNTTPSFTSFLQTQQSSSGLFGGFKPKGDDEGSDAGDEEGDDEPERTPSPEADITKSKGNYQYQCDYDKIASTKVTKFKPGVKNILSEGDVSLNKKQDSNSHFVLYRNKAKLVQYQGQIIPNLTKTEYLNPRQDALSVILYSVEVPQESTEKKAEGAGETTKTAFTKDIVKIMFATSDDCNEFKKALDKVLA